MKNIFILLLVTKSLVAFAQIPANYYDDALGLTGFTLKSELHSIITNGHSDQGYAALYYGYESTDTDNYYENDGSVLDMYSENPSGTDPYYYTHGNNTCGNYNSENDCYNREHIVPQSVFGSASPMKNDIHFVVPSDGYVNGRRSNYAFGEVSNPSWTSLNGSKVGSNTYGSYTGTVFEPIDEFKGDIARMLFYFATRYETQVDSWSHDMFNGTEDVVFADWFLDMILEWHYADPVSQREDDRNHAAYEFQGNANPFISHPEWVSTIWDPTPDNEAPTAPTNLYVSNETSTSFELFWDASTDNVAVVGYDIYKNGVLAGSSNIEYFVLNGLNPVTSYNLYVVARDAASNESVNSETIIGTTLAIPFYLVNEDFNDCTTVATNFTPYNEASDKDWTCLDQYGYDDTGCYRMNGYQEDVLSKDWLITTNKIDFTTYSNMYLSFYLLYKYGNSPLELLYSTGYNGSGNPSSYTWQSVPNLTIDTPTGTTEGSQQITNIDISSIPQDAYLAFKYYSNGTPTRWTLDNFSISANNGIGVNDYSLEKMIKIFPNPTNNILNIATVPNLNIDSIAIYSTTGKLLKTYKYSEKSFNIDIKGFSKGIYYLHINLDKGNIVKKIILN
ncbi:MAG TPA: T9SS type A sorting domain-containing protein [Lutibacter sp.]|nr:T9SS type A sorting domain-containing protein [Lutibacter sp.]